MCRRSLSLPLSFALLCVALPGVDAQTENNCRCKGAVFSHGECGFHLHFGSNDDKPWCRTVNKCGTSSVKGAWDYCDARSVEKRYANDGKLYTAKEFQTQYGKGADGADKWKAAKLYVERRVAKDGNAYSAADLRAHYIDSWGEQGWLSFWQRANAEQRKAADGERYGFEDFIKYDSVNGWQQWADASETSGARVLEEKAPPAATVGPDGCQCFGKGSQHGHCGFHFHFGSAESTPWCRTSSSCGENGMFGSWAYCSEEAVERRRLMSAVIKHPQGSLVTANDLRKSNPKDGGKIWKEAESHVERRMAGGQAYDVHEFRKYYINSFGEKGWVEKWSAADAEQRKANDGKWYTWEEFGEFYSDKASSMWGTSYSHTEL